MKKTFITILCVCFVYSLSAQVPKLFPFKEKHSQRIVEVSQFLEDKPACFGSPYQDRAMWNSVKEKVNYDEIIKQAETIMSTPMPEWVDSLYLEFSKNGVRPPGERMISQRRSRLWPLVLAECLENKGRFVPSIEYTLKEVISHPSWVLPAHDRGLTVFHGKKHEVDLVAAIFAHELAVNLYFLDDKISSSIRKEVVDSMYTRVFDPVLYALQYGKGYTFNWLNETNNWNAVCLGGVTGAALGVIEDRKERALFLAAAEYYAQNSLIGYTDDGYCTEGLGYYNYGFENFIVLREVMYQRTKGKIDLFDHPKMNNIAMYGINFEIINNVYPAFADCRIGTKTSPFILWYCNRNQGMGIEKYNSYEPGNKLSAIMSAFLYFPNTASLSPVKESLGNNDLSLRNYFKDAGVLISRPVERSASSMGVAMKAGHNAEHHNHNDIGSYAIVIGDETLVGDPGGPYHYAGDMWTEKRYTFKTIASYGHPVPVINNTWQQPGRKARGEITKTDFTDTKDRIVMDLRTAYDLPALQKLERAFTYDRTDGEEFIIEDRFKLEEAGEFETALTTLLEWEAKDNGIIQIKGQKNNLFVRIETSDGSNYTLIPETLQENGPLITRIAIRLNSKQTSGYIRLKFNTTL